jgi:hypothetical protein
MVQPLLPQMDSGKLAGYHRRKSTDIRLQPGAARRQSQVWRSKATRGGGRRRWRKALRVSFVAWQVVDPRIAGVIIVVGIVLRSRDGEKTLFEAYSVSNLFLKISKTGTQLVTFNLSDQYGAK